MKELVIYYSFTGNCKKIAESLGKNQDAVICEIKEKKKSNKISAYIFGSFKAMRKQEATIEPISASLNDFDQITIVMPLWAGSPAPEMNNIISLLPPNKEVHIIMVSGSGNSSNSKEDTIQRITARGCKVVSYEDRKS